jgi:hypothetical protein
MALKDKLLEALDEPIALHDVLPLLFEV